MNRDEMIDVLSVVAAATRRTVGRADVEIWMGICGDVPEAFARQAIRDHMRDSPGVWLEPGHIWQRWKAYRRDESGREIAAEIHSAEAIASQRRLKAIAAGVNTDAPAARKRKTPDLELSVRCPWMPCRADVGRACVGHDGKPLRKTKYHPSRTDLANGIPAA